ncbi:MAG: hypothetical protein O8C66_06695 [Candidatus Methanoperedens sp.]|nr:hypothetical protein [Candidatus Methanoperedens sp.]MCZ7370180.1 hypothetical protein [Candidatus Methanoperedens sp.]
MESNQFDIKSLRGYGIHGALGLLMGIGVGYIIFYTIPSLTAAYLFMVLGVVFAILVIYGLYGLYVGFIFGGQKKSSRISMTCAVAGAFGALVTGVLLAGEFIKMSGLLDPLFITLVFAGPILGFPKIKNMVLMTISSSLGAALGYGIYVLGQNITVYLNSVWTQGALLAFFIAILFPLLAIGIAGASIAIGMYFMERTSYTPREIPRFLKIARGAGIVLTFIILFISALMFISAVKYATTDVSIDVSSGDGRITVFVPVLLESGSVMEMYGNPEISGNATTEVIDTNHGKAFKISGSGSTRINMNQTGGSLATNPEANEKFVNGFTLSTSNATGYGGISVPVDAWVYSEEDGTMFSLSINRDNGWGRDVRISTEREEKLTRGWQVIRLSVGSMWYD